MELRSRIAPLFDGWQEAVIWSYLEGHMGEAFADDIESPRSACIVLGDFAFFGGEPNADLIRRIDIPILTPQNDAWAKMIERTLGSAVTKSERYAIEKTRGIFNREHLLRLAKAPDGYTLRLFDRDLCTQAMENDWSRDFCANYRDADHFLSHGLGIAAVQNGTLVAGASSYCHFDGGIEVEIVTREDHRRKGLATACGAALILACLDRDLYPSWDARTLHSVALAQKLGYRYKAPYTVYLKNT